MTALGHSQRRAASASAHLALQAEVAQDNIAEFEKIKVVNDVVNAELEEHRRKEQLFRQEIDHLKSKVQLHETDTDNPLSCDDLYRLLPDIASCS